MPLGARLRLSRGPHADSVHRRWSGLCRVSFWCEFGKYRP